jgi:hypothetical protein
MDKFYVRGIDKEGDECFYTGKAGAGFAHWDRANAYYGYPQRLRSNRGGDPRASAAEQA